MLHPDRYINPEVDLEEARNKLANARAQEQTEAIIAANNANAEKMLRAQERANEMQREHNEAMQSLERERVDALRQANINTLFNTCASVNNITPMQIHNEIEEYMQRDPEFIEIQIYNAMQDKKKDAAKKEYERKLAFWEDHKHETHLEKRRVYADEPNIIGVLCGIAGILLTIILFFTGCKMTDTYGPIGALLAFLAFLGFVFSCVVSYSNTTGNYKVEKDVEIPNYKKPLDPFDYLACHPTFSFANDVEETEYLGDKFEYRYYNTDKATAAVFEKYGYNYYDYV